MEEPKQKKGFNVMSPERRKEIASLGGKAAQARGTAHKWDSETAAAASKKGLSKRHPKKGPAEAPEEPQA
jgi:general stress protein YciG